MSENSTVETMQDILHQQRQAKSKEVLFPRRFELIDFGELSMCSSRMATPFAMR